MQDSALRGFLQLWEKERIGDKEKEGICNSFFICNFNCKNRY
jgi:hypothetical protein